MSDAHTGEPLSATAGSAAASGTASCVPGVLLAVSAAAFAFTCLLYAYVGGGITEKEESRIFALSCLVVPLAGIVASWGLERARRRLFASDPFFFVVLTVAHAAFWAIAVHRMRAALPPPETGEHVDLRPLFGSLIVTYVVGNVLLLVLLREMRGLLRNATGSPSLSRWVDRGIPFLLFAALLPFATRAPQPNGVLVLLAIAGVASLVHGELSRFPRTTSARYAFDALVLAALALAVINPAGDVEVLHHNFYLGPVAAVRAGRSLLVDINCQYGVGVIYFIAAVFDLRLVAPSVGGFATLIGVLLVLQYAVIYATLRSITRSVALSAAVLALMVCVSSFGGLSFPSAYPSTGPIRFLLGYLFVACIALRGRFPRHRVRLFVLEALVVGAASIWSLESFVYVLVAYLGSVVYETAHVGRSEVRRELACRFLPAILSVGAFHGALALLTYARAGEWPHWSRYLDYIRLYSVQEFGCLPVEPWTPWILIAGAYVVSIVALGYRRVTLRKADLKNEYAVVFGMSALGVAQFTYYVGRSHSNNLFHVCVPAFFVAGYWFIRTARGAPGVSDQFRKSFVFVCYGAAALLWFTAVPELARKFDHTLLSFVISGRAPTEIAPSARSVDAAALMLQYAPERRRVAFFSSADINVQTMLLAHKASLWPLAYQHEDALLEEAKVRIFAHRDGLTAGDVIFVDTGSSRPVVPDHVALAPDADAIDRRLWAGVASRFDFEIVEARPSGVVALRLAARP